MSASDNEHWIVVTEDARTLPVEEVLTGRAFLTGKSGSGKSNTCSVVAEELLDAGYNLLIVDTEGEYYGLKEEYELLHVGGDDFADVIVEPDQAEEIAELAIKENVPVILDVSGFDETEVSEELIERVVEELYSIEKRARKPFLVIVEEMQEYLPQQGGGGDLAELLERVAKRGRKRGLGLLGVSQRPSSVDKDFITQCDWLVWHKVTWNADVDVVREVLGSEAAEQIQEFEPGEAFLMTDWDDRIEKVKFKEKRTYDAGATPGLESYERPDLNKVGSDIINRLDGDVSESGPETLDLCQGLEPDQQTNIEVGEVEAEPINGVVEEDGVSESDFENMTEEELRMELASSKKQIRVLKDEISELKSMLDQIDSEDSNKMPFRAYPGETGNPIQKPTPPDRPKDRTGIAGNIMEFGFLVMYIIRWVYYQLRLGVFHLKSKTPLR